MNNQTKGKERNVAPKSKLKPKQTLSAHKPKPATATVSKALLKPKRPLSAYNLFYRFKRDKIISIGEADRDDIIRLVKTAPGLEDYAQNTLSAAEPHLLHALNEIRRINIRKSMAHNLLPTDTRNRSHRRNEKAINGAISFLELGKLMNTSWQGCDQFAKSVFNELADEGRELYRLRLEKYIAANGKDMKACSTKAEANSMKDVNSVPVENKSSSAPRFELTTSKSGPRPYEYNSSNTQGHHHSVFNQGFSWSDHQVMRMATNNHGASPTGHSGMQGYEPHAHSHAQLSEYNQFFNQGGPMKDHVMERMLRDSRGAVPARYNDHQGMDLSDLKDLAQQARLMDLEAKLATAKLEARLVELQGSLARQRALENKLRAQLMHDQSRSRSAAVPATSYRDGLSSHHASANLYHPDFVHSDASLLHQSVQRPAYPSGMHASRNELAMKHMMDCLANVPPKKRQRYD